MALIFAVNAKGRRAQLEVEPIRHVPDVGAYPPSELTSRDDTLDTHVPSQQHFGEISAFARAGRSSRRLIKSQFSDPSHQLSDCVVASKQRRQAYDEGHQIGNTPGSRNCRSLTPMPARSTSQRPAPNFGVARV